MIFYEARLILFVIWSICIFCFGFVLGANL